MPSFLTACTTVLFLNFTCFWRGMALVFKATLIVIKLLFQARDGAGVQGHSD
jgi:hypothetical protein